MNLKRYFPDKIVWILIAANLFFAGLFCGLNAIFTQYQGNQYVPMLWVYFMPLLLALYVVSNLWYEHAPRITYFTRSYTLYLFLLISFGALATGIQYSPFPPIDSQLVRFDQFLGFSTPALVSWTMQHPVFKSILEHCYYALDFELFFIPLFTVYLGERERVEHFFVMIGLAFLFACFIYYFLPTAAPVSVFKNVPFLPQEHYTSIKFFEIHHHLPVTINDSSLVAFPSMHVVWTLALLYLSRRQLWLFYPLCVLSALVILATLCLGWHYLADVLAGFALTAVSAYLGHELIKSSH